MRFNVVLRPDSKKSLTTPADGFPYMTVALKGFIDEVLVGRRWSRARNRMRGVSRSLSGIVSRSFPFGVWDFGCAIRTRNLRKTRPQMQDPDS